ncbi:MAG: Spy/CpxP family protein refolding chaperone [Burkholderiaceae bacterium]
MTRFTLPPAWRYVALGLAVSAAGAFGIVNMASAHDRAEPPPMVRGMGGPGAPLLPLMGPMLERMLDDVQATPEQREKLRQIALAAQADLKAPGEAARADHAKMAQLFVQPSIDPAAVEALRQQMLARHDQVSKRMNVAMLDAAKVLTLEQRQKLAERMQQHEARRAERGMHPDMPPPGGAPR